MDAQAMYTNIDFKHGMYILKQFLYLFKDKLPADFPVELVLEAVSLVTENNIFEFGDCYFKQLVGEAMGAPHAAVKAIIYYAYHEITVLLKKYKRHLLYYGRFIDDGFGAWNDLDDPTAWDRFKDDVNDFGILKWDINAPCQEVVFLDITICINNENRIETRTYSKPQNIYQYIPQRSAHPLKVGRSIIFGKMQRYHLQNSKRKDFIEQVDLLYERMKARGWQHSLLYEWILESSEKFETRINKPTTAPKTEEDTSNTDAHLFICNIIREESDDLKFNPHFLKHAITSKALLLKLTNLLLQYQDQEIYAMNLSLLDYTKSKGKKHQPTVQPWKDNTLA